MGQIRPGHLEVEGRSSQKASRLLWEILQSPRHISLAEIPAAFPGDSRYGCPPAQAEAIYNAGRISRDALELWQALAKFGPLPTLELRHSCKMEAQAGNKRFKKAMLELQGLLIVTHSGAEQETESWASNRFDLVARVFPKQLAQARQISSDDARRAIAVKYKTLYPAAIPAQIARLFSWTKEQAATALCL